MIASLSVDGAAVAARWAIAVSGLIIAVNHVWMWHRDRERRAERYQQTLLFYAASIGLVFLLPLLCQSTTLYRYARWLEIVAGGASIAHAVASIRYSEWLHLVARWSNYERTAGTNKATGDE